MIAFTYNWRVKCRRFSLTDTNVYYVDLATGIDRVVADQLAAQLKKDGQRDVEVVLIHTIP